MSTFTAAAIIPAYENIADDLGVSIQQVSYLTSLQIVILGVAPLFWRPIATRYGRRPIFLLSLAGSLAFNVGCGYCPDYASVAACRALVAWFICPASAIGSAVVTECFFKKQRARYIGIWTLMVTLGVPLSAFIFGFVTLRVGYRWIYFTLAITNAVQLILYALLGPETRYLRTSGAAHPAASPGTKYQLFRLRRIDPTPFRLHDFVSPLRFVAHASVMVPAAAYAMVFLFSSVMTTVEIPQLFIPKFHFDAQQLGLQYLGIIIGSILGEQIGGLASDAWMARRRRAARPAPPEHRLWLSYPGYALAIAGTVVFLLQTDAAAPGRWDVTPIVGAAIAAAGNQLITTVLITYAVDAHPRDAAGVGVFITLVRQVWGFVGPFWFPQMFAEVGLRVSAAIAAALMIAVAILPTAVLQAVKGRRAG